MAGNEEMEQIVEFLRAKEAKWLNEEPRFLGNAADAAFNNQQIKIETSWRGQLSRGGRIFSETTILCKCESTEASE